jgi:hypothetical protein
MNEFKGKGQILLSREVDSLVDWPILYEYLAKPIFT